MSYNTITDDNNYYCKYSLYGWYTTSGWTVIRVNFTNIFSSMCIMSDYYVWKPYDEVCNY